MSSPNPDVRLIRDHQLQDRDCEGGGDRVLDDLRVRNLAEAVIHGGLGTRAELGALIGELLCAPRKDRR